MWTPFPLTTQLVGWVNLLEKCEGAYVIMMIRSSPHALPAALMVADCGRSKESGACGSLYKGKNTHRRHGEQVRGKGRGGDVNRFFLLLYTKPILDQRHRSPLQKQKCRQTVGSCDGTFAGCLLRCINRAVRDKAQQAPCPSRGSVRTRPRLLCGTLALSSETV